MRKLLSTMFVLATLVALAVSCEFGPEPTQSNTDSDKASVKFIPQLAEGKALSVSDNPTYVWLEYQATPGFEDSSAVISGRVTGEWKRIEKKDTDSDTYTTPEEFTKGFWKFDVQVGAGDTVFYTGHVEAILKQDKEAVNVQLIPKFNTEARGTVKFDISTPELSAAAGSFNIKIYDSTKTNLITTAKDGEEVINFSNYNLDAVIENHSASFEKTLSLVPGVYILEIKYTSGGASTESSIIAFKVIEGCISELTGSIENGAYVSATISLSRFKGSITNSGSTYTFTPSGSYPGTTSYMWFVNGVNKNTNTASYTFAETEKGAYCLTCVATNTNQNNTDVISVSKIVEVK